ncbi:MAG: pentapeptide repeat-containing protein [Pseudomonadota bacterium]
MANEQHVEWLCEGVETWNARRQREDFRPDFSEAGDLVDRLRTAGVIASDHRANLVGANLKGANLRWANLRGADLRRANLSWAKLRGADLRGADLREAVLREANLAGADLREAKLVGADLREVSLLGADLREAKLVEAKLRKANLAGADLRQVDLGEANLRLANLREANLAGADLRRAYVATVGTSSDANDRVDRVPTDLSSSRNLTQRQLDQMTGDQWTLIPEGLIRPAHWLEKTDELETDAEDESETGAQGEKPAQSSETNSTNEPAPSRDENSSASIFRSQVDIVLRTAAAAEITSNGIAGQLDYALQAYRQEASTNQVPDDVLLVEKFSDLLKSLATEIVQPEPDQDRLAQQLQDMEQTIAELTAVIEAQATEIAALKSAPSGSTNWDKMKSSFATSFGKTMGSATAGAIVAGSGYLLGAYGAEPVALLGNAFSKLFAVAPPMPLPSGTTLL